MEKFCWKTEFLRTHTISDNPIPSWKAWLSFYTGLIRIVKRLKRNLDNTTSYESQISDSTHSLYGNQKLYVEPEQQTHRNNIIVPCVLYMHYFVLFIKPFPLFANTLELFHQAGVIKFLFVDFQNVQNQLFTCVWYVAICTTSENQSYSIKICSENRKRDRIS